MRLSLRWDRVWLYAAALLSAGGLILVFGCGKKESEAVPRLEGNPHTHRGIQKYEQGDYEGAIVFYEKAVALDPSQDKAYLDLGILYEDYKGDAARAAACYRKFLELNPKGDKAKMVQEWLQRLEEKKTVAPVLAATAKPASQAVASAAPPPSDKTFERHKAEIEALKLQLDIVTKSEAGLTLKIKELKKAHEEKLQETEKKAAALNEQVAKLEAEKKSLAEQRNKKTDESAIQKREALRFEEEALALKRRHEKETMALKDEIEKMKKERGFSLTQAQQQIDRLTQDERRLKQAFAQATEERTRLEKALTEKEEKIRSLESRIAALERGRLAASVAPQPAPAPVSPPRPGAKKSFDLVTYHRVKRGETLMMIAGYEHIYGDRAKWKIIYEANKDNIDDPNVLVPGQILLVPR